MSKKMSTTPKKPTRTFKTESQAGKIKNQLAEPANKGSKIPMKSQPPAKTAKSKVEDVKKHTENFSKFSKSPLRKREAKSPEIIKPESDKPNDALTYQKAMKKHDLVDDNMGEEGSKQRHGSLKNHDIESSKVRVMQPTHHKAPSVFDKAYQGDVPELLDDTYKRNVFKFEDFCF